MSRPGLERSGGSLGQPAAPQQDLMTWIHLEQRAEVTHVSTFQELGLSHLWTEELEGSEQAAEAEACT